MSTCIDDLSAIDAARRLGIDLNRLYVLLRLGRIGGQKVNGEWRVQASAVEQRLQVRQRAATV
jgi:predicted site-specific integrase-resolvase